jgi:hypothetical protein
VDDAKMKATARAYREVRMFVFMSVLPFENLREDATTRSWLIVRAISA